MIQMTQKARERIQTLAEDQRTKQGRNVVGVQLAMQGLPRPNYTLAFVEAGKQSTTDVLVEVEGIQIFMEARDASFLEDVTIDYISNLQQTGFRVDNPKPPPDLSDPNAKAPETDEEMGQVIKKVLDLEINPGVASHGGQITLIEVKNRVAYIEMRGGCQGCGMASATLTQGVVAAIKKAVPAITDVIDTTNHASGEQPYFAPKR